MKLKLALLFGLLFLGAVIAKRFDNNYDDHHNDEDEENEDELTNYDFENRLIESYFRLKKHDILKKLKFMRQTLLKRNEKDKESFKNDVRRKRSQFASLPDRDFLLSTIW